MTFCDRPSMISTVTWDNGLKHRITSHYFTSPPPTLFPGSHSLRTLILPAGIFWIHTRSTRLIIENEQFKRCASEYSCDWQKHISTNIRISKPFVLMLMLMFIMYWPFSLEHKLVYACACSCIAVTTWLKWGRKKTVGLVRNQLEINAGNGGNTWLPQSNYFPVCSGKSSRTTKREEYNRRGRYNISAGQASYISC